MEKLLLINSSLGNGGAERQMVKLIELLNEKNITPFVLTYGNLADDYPTTAKMLRINVSCENKWVRNFKLLWIIIKICPKNILSYCGDPNTLALIYKLFNWKCNVITSERNLVQLPLAKRQKLLYFLYSFADKIISNSESQRLRLSKLYPNLENKILTIRNFTKVNKDCKFVESHKKKELVILVCARYHPQKNVHRFLEALYKVNSNGLKNCYRVIWHGQNIINGEESDYYQSCIALKTKFNLDNVELLGYDKDVVNTLRLSDIVCLPSLYEGFSNSLSEGICNGKPIIASDISDNICFVQPGINGYLFNPFDTDDIAEKISLIISQRSKIPEMCKKSIEIAHQLFDSETFINSYIKLFK